jgi:hypothetical protein
MANELKVPAVGNMVWVWVWVWSSLNQISGAKAELSRQLTSNLLLRALNNRASTHFNHTVSCFLVGFVQNVATNGLLLRPAPRPVHGYD